jgi:hypothetical protein
LQGKKHWDFLTFPGARPARPEHPRCDASGGGAYFFIGITGSYRLRAVIAYPQGNPVEGLVKFHDTRISSTRVTSLPFESLTENLKELAFAEAPKTIWPERSDFSGILPDLIW